MDEKSQDKLHERVHTEVCLSRADELPDSVEAAECKPNSCNEKPLANPASANGKVPTNCSSEGTASGSQTTFEGPLTREGSKSASNDLCARGEANAEDMYQLKLELEESSLEKESACWRKMARDLSTKSLDFTGNKYRPKKKPTGTERLTADESTTLAVDVACGVSSSGNGVCQSFHLTHSPKHTSFPELGPGTQQSEVSI